MFAALDSTQRSHAILFALASSPLSPSFLAPKTFFVSIDKKTKCVHFLRADVDSQVILFVFLPVLIFESAFETDVHIFRREFWQVGFRLDQE